MFSSFDSLANTRRAIANMEFIGGNADDNSERQFVVPEQAMLVAIYTVGGGGGGGGGCGGAANTARGGGGAGGSAPHNINIFPVYALPRILVVIVGAGGAGGAGGSSGTGGTGVTGGWTRVRVGYTNTDIVHIAYSSGGGGGSGGSSTAGGNGGANGGIGTAAPLFPYNIYFMGRGVQSGRSGGAHTGAAGTVASLSSGGHTMHYPSTGGGGCGTDGIEYAGGACPVINNTPFVYNSPGGNAGGGAGQDSFAADTIRFCGYIYGATGGGSSNSTTGGAGGRGLNYGTGGAGGGAGTTIGGDGGAGGPGYCRITCW